VYFRPAVHVVYTLLLVYFRPAVQVVYTLLLVYFRPAVHVVYTLLLVYFRPAVQVVYTLLLVYFRPAVLVIYILLLVYFRPAVHVIYTLLLVSFQAFCSGVIYSEISVVGVFSGLLSTWCEELGQELLVRHKKPPGGDTDRRGGGDMHPHLQKPMGAMGAMGPW